MAKDPAFLFYPSDWLSGTMYFTFEQKGAYFELLMLQFNNGGRFTEAQAKQVLSICPSIWLSIKEKFKTDGQYFWNERLKLETEKRQKFSESRRKNAASVKQPIAYAEHMHKHMENTNENEDILKEVSGSHAIWGKRILSETFNADKEAIEVSTRKFITQQVISEFNAHLAIERKKHINYNEYIKHLSNWLRKKKTDIDVNEKPNKQAYKRLD